MSTKKKTEKKPKKDGDDVQMNSIEANTLIMQQLLNLTKQMNDIQVDSNGGNGNKAKKKKPKKKDRSPEYDDDDENDENGDDDSYQQNPRNNNHYSSRTNVGYEKDGDYSEPGFYPKPKRQMNFRETDEEENEEDQYYRGNRERGYSDNYDGPNYKKSSKVSPSSSIGGNGKKLSYNQQQVYETKIQELEEKLASVEATLSNTTNAQSETINSLKDQLNANEDAIFRSQSECLRLKGEKAFLDVEVETLKKKLITMETHYRKFEHNLQSEFQTELQRLNGMNTLKQADKTGLVSEYEVKISKISAELRSRTQDLHRMEAHLSNVEGERKELEVKNGQLESRFRLVQSTNDQLENRMRQIEAERSEIANEYKLLKNNYRDLDIEYKAVSKKAAAFKAERDVLFVQVEMLEDKNGGNLSQFKSELTATTNKLTEANTRANNLEKSLNFAMKELKLARERLAGGTGVGASGAEFQDSMAQRTNNIVKNVIGSDAVDSFSSSSSFQSPSLQPTRPLIEKNTSSLLSSPRGGNFNSSLYNSIDNGSSSNNGLLDTSKLSNNNALLTPVSATVSSSFDSASLKLPSFSVKNNTFDSMAVPAHMLGNNVPFGGINSSSNNSGSNNNNNHRASGIAGISMSQIAANKLNIHSTTFHPDHHPDLRNGPNAVSSPATEPKIKFPEKITVRESILKTSGVSMKDSNTSSAPSINFESPMNSASRTNLQKMVINEDDTSEANDSSGIIFEKEADYLDFEKIQQSMTSKTAAEGILKELSSKKKSVKKEINQWLEDFKKSNGREASRQEKEANVGPKFEVYNKLGFIITKIEGKIKDNSIPDKMQRMMRQAMGGMGGMGAQDEGPQRDTAEKIQISSLSLLKMLKHGKAGVPMEVMGLMLGEEIDDYTITCIDVFAMPQHGTGASVEAIDETFQVEMLDMLKQTDRSQSVVGWYHSHPGFGCWLSSVDINTQTSFEGLNPRCVAVVIDPVQSVKGKVAIDAFRLFPQEMMMAMMMGGMGGGNEPRQTTSNVGFLKKPTIQARIHGLDRMYYSLVVDWRKNDVEEQMLMNLHKKNWSTGLVLPKIEDHQASTLSLLDKMTKLSKDYAERVKEEDGKSKEEIYLLNVGKVDPKKHLENTVYDLVSLNILQCLGTMVNTVVF